jgi:hypothetical protein
MENHLGPPLSQRQTKNGKDGKAQLMWRGAGWHVNISLPPAEGGKCLLTSPLIGLVIWGVGVEKVTELALVSAYSVPVPYPNGIPSLSRRIAGKSNYSHGIAELTSVSKANTAFAAIGTSRKLWNSVCLPYCVPTWGRKHWSGRRGVRFKKGRLWLCTPVWLFSEADWNQFGCPATMHITAIMVKLSIPFAGCVS